MERHKQMAEQQEPRQAKEAHKDQLLQLPNVVGVGVGYREVGGQTTDEVVVSVLVEEKVPVAALTAEQIVPTTVSGVRTDVIQVGHLRALQSRTDRHRPVPGGVSLGHFRITAGTFGAVVRDNTTQARLILSNNHVLANSNDASPGDAILQPGAADGGSNPGDVIAHLERFCPIDFGVEESTCNIANTVAAVANVAARMAGSRHQLQPILVRPQATNLADAAVARPVSDDIILDEILEIGEVSGTMSASLGQSVRKSGRSTGFTTGTITVLNATISVSYGTNRTATFEDQIVTSAMSAPGDSGSLLVDGGSLRAVGLLFAGSDQTTIHSPIQAVLNCLNVTI
jgi:hypothetical protein